MRFATDTRWILPPLPSPPVNDLLSFFFGISVLCIGIDSGSDGYCGTPSYLSVY